MRWLLSPPRPGLRPPSGNRPPNQRSNPPPVLPQVPPPREPVFPPPQPESRVPVPCAQVAAAMRGPEHLPTGRRWGWVPFPPSQACPCPDGGPSSPLLRGGPGGPGTVLWSQPLGSHTSSCSAVTPTAAGYCATPWLAPSVAVLHPPVISLHGMFTRPRGSRLPPPTSHLAPTTVPATVPVPGPSALPVRLPRLRG